MTNKDIKQFKELILKKVEEILYRDEVGKDVVEIKIDVDWNLYQEPVITTTSTAMYIDVIDLTKEEESED